MTVTVTAAVDTSYDDDDNNSNNNLSLLCY